MIGVRISRMTEPSDTHDWWVLPDRMKNRIDAARQAWETKPNFVPSTLKPLKRRRRSGNVEKSPAKLPAPPPVSDPIAKVGFSNCSFLNTFAHVQVLESFDVRMPAMLVYDLARAHVARGITFGGVRVLWNQFSTSPFPPLPYLAFKAVFSEAFGWKKYNTFHPPTEPGAVLHRPEARAKKDRSLSYDYSVKHMVCDHNDCPHLLDFFRFPTRKSDTWRAARTWKTGSIFRHSGQQILLIGGAPSV